MATVKPPGHMRAIGLMSGTSLDGIDIALIETDGQQHVWRGPSAAVAYEPAFRMRLMQALIDARAITDRDERPGTLRAVEQELTKRHADAVLAFMGQNSLQPSAVDCIGFHGQTVLHRDLVGVAAAWPTGTINAMARPMTIDAFAPTARKLTVQLGDGRTLAKLTGVDVVYDLRAADCDGGGQGAPLVPVYHRALVAKLPQRPVAVVNVGGVANVSYIGPNGSLIAFDTGPGNALIDDWMMKHVGVARDEDGQAAARGVASEDVVRFYLNHSFFADTPPKSLDRASFFSDLVDGLSVDDGAATLTAFTAQSIARAREHMPQEPQLWIVCGGGRRNRTLMSMLAARVENAVVPAEAVALDGDMIEAEAWAYLAVRSVLKLPITFPGTTGVERPTSGGVFASAAR
jgi:anhydro-N-acetylmuramic acid kinase